MTVRAVLFDVGGPLDTEILHEHFVDKYILRAVRAVGRTPTDTEFAEATAAVVANFAPDAYAAIIWRLCGEDTEAAREALRLFQQAWSAERHAERGGIELRPGIGHVLKRLHSSGLLLGLAANQPARIIDELDRQGLGKLFSHREVSGHHGYRKPDVRLFLRACEDLGVEPAECIMVGDRIDNDIFPARLLGMRTVLIRTGRHIEQRPRTLDEVPDFTVTTVEEMESAILALCTNDQPPKD